MATGQSETSNDNATSLDELISGASKQADELQKAATPKPEQPAIEAKAAKKEKDKAKAPKLVYSDNEMSPEEKMARLPRYAFVPHGKEETATAGTTGAVDGGAVGTSRMVDVQG